MSNAARKDEALEDKVSRLLVRVERLANDVERLLARHEHAARRAANLAGPTTPEAEAIVARKHKRYGL